MKKIFCFLCTILAVVGCSKEKETHQTAAGKIAISGAWALYPLVKQWAELYQKQNPQITITVTAGGACKGMSDALSGAADLGMVSREITKSEMDRGAWWVSVAKDAVVPTINNANPLGDELLKKGMTRREFAQIWINGTITGWSGIIKTGKALPIHVYTRSDACGASETWAKYLGGTLEDIKGKGAYGDPGLIDALRKDSLGIGYNNIQFVYDPQTRKPVPGIRPVPIDINGSGKIEPDENFYDDRELLTKAIAENKYPSPPARNLHLVSRGIPEKEHVRAFLLWIMGEGQLQVKEAGYISLPGEMMKKQAERLMKKQ
jgi:phosphate transport system substrate-binding protein